MMTHAQKTTLKTVLLTATLLASAAGAYAQTPPAFGHWEGILTSPLGSTALHVDIGADEAGRSIAALSLPDENIAGLPLGNVKIDGDTVGFDMPISSEGSFRGALSKNGKSFTGLLDKGFGSADFSLTRTGEARFPAPPKNPAIDVRYEGEYSGGLGEGGPVLRVSLANKAGAAVGVVAVNDGVAIPLSITQSGETLKLDIASAGEVIAVRLDPGGDLVGDYVSSGGARSLTLRRVPKG
jgi:hypothetical protein